MSKLNYSKCYLDSLRLIVVHDYKDDIVLNYGSFFKQLSKNTNSKLNIHNVASNAPAEVPRVLIANSDFQINFSLNRVEVNFIGSRKHLVKKVATDFFKIKVKESLGILNSYFSRDEFKVEYSGILGPLRFPQKNEVTKDFLTKKVSSFFCPNSRLGNILNFSLRLGFMNTGNDAFINYEISIYEVKNINIKSKIENNGQPVTINLEDFPTVEHGVQFVVDVNNRPNKKNESFEESINLLFNEFTEAVTSDDFYLGNYASSATD